MFKIPEGAGCQDSQWQAGYADGEEEVRPRYTDATYLSGWCHGFCGANQCSTAEAERACQAMQQGQDS